MSAQSPMNRIRRENPPSTPLLRKTRPLPGPSPLSLKRSNSLGSSSDRAKRRRTRSSDLVLQKRVSSLLEQAQSFVRSDEIPVEPKSQEPPNANISSDEFPCDADLEILAAKVDMDPLSWGNVELMELGEPMNLDAPIHLRENPAIGTEERSDDLFDTTFDDLNIQELESLDASSNIPKPTTNPQPPAEEDESFFEDGFDDLMNLDLETTQPEVRNFLDHANQRHPSSRRPNDSK